MSKKLKCWKCGGARKQWEGLICKTCAAANINTAVTAVK